MDLREVVEKYKQFKVPSLSTICEMASQYSKTCLLAVIILFLVFIYLVQQIPHWQVAQFGIINPKDIADAENSYRATLAQIFGGIAIAIGLYYTWRRITIAEEDLKATKEGQITERFTRAVEQLGAIDQQGNPAIEIRLGGIYALERIANESKKDHWPIMEILTAYVRKNAALNTDKNNQVTISMEIQADESTKNEISKLEEIALDIQAILTVIGRRKVHSDIRVTGSLNLQGAFLRKANLVMANLSNANLEMVNLEEAYLLGANLDDASLFMVNLKGANLRMSHFERAILIEANFEGADFMDAYLSSAMFSGANLTYAYFSNVDLNNAYLRGANLAYAYFSNVDLSNTYLRDANLTETSFKGVNLKGAKNLTIDQLSKVNTLYGTKLDPELEKPVREKYPALFEEPIDEP